jgi:hypothetical protein
MLLNAKTTEAEAKHRFVDFNLTLDICIKKKCLPDDLKCLWERVLDADLSDEEHSKGMLPSNNDEMSHLFWLWESRVLPIEPGKFLLLPICHPLLTLYLFGDAFGKLFLVFFNTIRPFMICPLFCFQRSFMLKIVVCLSLVMNFRQKRLLNLAMQCWIRYGYHI